jgi:hypothetical protein
MDTNGWDSPAVVVAIITLVVAIITLVVAIIIGWKELQHGFSAAYEMCFRPKLPRM